jgi:signal transduction histidine kinase
MRRLYLRIYAAVLASLLALSLLIGAAWQWWGRSHDRPQAQALLAQVADELLPRDAGPDALRDALARWRERTGADLALHSPDGTLIAAAGAPMPAPPPGAFDDGERGRWLRARDGPPAYALRLDDGRVLVAGRLWRTGTLGGPRPPAFVATLALVALAIALGAYPVVRRLTRRLEGLQRSVERLGAGDLSARVPESGSDEVAALAASFNRSAERIEALVRSQKSLLANASHELRSPLARLRMAVELLADRDARSSPELRDEVRRNVAELDAVVEEILLASRLDTAPELERQPVDLRALLVEECARAAAACSFDAATVPDGPHDRCTVDGDSRLLRRLVRNLLENAQRHGAGSPIEVLLSAPAGRVDFDVCDRGPGVPEDERERIFEPFHRLGGRSE